MERGLSENSVNESWSSHDEGERKSPKKRKKTRNKKRNGEQTIAVPLEAMPKKPLREATIWERPANTVEVADSKAKPVPAAKRSEEHSVPAARDEVSPKDVGVTDTHVNEAVALEQLPELPPETQLGQLDMSWVDQFAGAPENMRDPGKKPSQEREPQELPADKPLAEPRRSSFWTEAEVRQPQAAASLHDILPPVASQAPVSSERATEPQPSPTTLRPEVMLDRAVNPNLIADEVSSRGMEGRAQRPDMVQPTRDGLGSYLSPATNFLGRRRSQAAVKSQSMAHYNFEASSLSPEVSQNETDSPLPIESPELVSAEDIERYEQPEAADNIRVAPSAEHPEHIGHVLVEAEKPEKTKPKATQELTPEQQMQRQEMLTMSETIRIDGVSVHEMFLANRIDEEGLRRVVTEYLRGGDVQKVIMSEVIRQQIKFERDPQLRSIPVKIPDAPQKRKPSRAKQRAKSVFDVQRTVERTERLADLAQKEVTRARRYFRTNPRATTIASVVAIAVIYTLIFIIVLR
jgi:hypothetical protein